MTDLETTRHEQRESTLKRWREKNEIHFRHMERLIEKDRERAMKHGDLCDHYADAIAYLEQGRTIREIKQMLPDIV
ncbi:hypothetical protein [Salisaeta icosahedral phage 1]|uniref:hypothetical protein n=1 Tax=Salisaeta icosahedral phage 1 TaxID=1183239 RepID=UPI00025EA920|nr:hypothetical protein A322_gp19 [Salisaeta icosahedral phage 1]AFJ21474.1 hypothetical protein [Salisaeta icosahedral phage 1]